MEGFTFTKDERLCGQKAIEALLAGGRSEFSFPLKVTWMISSVPQTILTRVAFAVPKRRFKRANKRNLLKRRLREAFRLNKALLNKVLSDRGISIDMLVVFVGPEIKEYKELELAMVSVFQKIIRNVQATN